jgi:GDP-L-fucose synthase
MVAEIVGYGGEIAWDTSKPNGQPRRCLDVTRARELFGFEAKQPLREGLEKTVAWFLANRALFRTTGQLGDREEAQSQRWA